MALKCKIASEASCGKDCCCYDCVDAKNCKDKCPTFDELGKKVLKECEELEQVEEQPECFGKFTDTEKCEEDVGCKMAESCKKTAEQTEIVTLDQKVPEAIKAMTNLLIQQKEMEKKISDMREVLKTAMEQYCVKSFENDDIKMTYIAPTERKSIDSAKLKKEHPEIAEAYQKVSQVKASVKIEIK